MLLTYLNSYYKNILCSFEGMLRLFAQTGPPMVTAKRRCTLESEAKRAPETQAAEGLGASRGFSPTHCLAAFLEGASPDAEKARVLELTCEKPFALVAIRSFSERSRINLREVNESLKGSHIPYTAIPFDDFVVALTSHADARNFIEEAAEKTLPGRYSAAISLPFESANDISRQYDLVRFCLLVHEGTGVHDAKDCALAYLVAEISSSVNTGSLLHPALDKLARYDELNQSSFLNTLKVYLEFDRNAQRCANALYLHRNSLQYRVRRIQEIAGIDLDDPVERAYLRLSFLIG